MSQDPGQPATTPPSQSVPEPPRPVTPKVRRRLWAEPQVRGWLLFTVALLLGAIFLAVRSYGEWRDETAVIRNGVPVQALAWHSGSNRVPGQTLTSTAQVDVEYTYEGKKYKSVGRQLYKTGAEYVSMQPFDVRVDPQKPENWTNRTDAPPVIEKMMGVGIMLAVAGVCAAVLLLQRLRCNRLWVHGDQVTARIVGRSQSALAPQSVGLRCAMRDGKTDRLVSVYVPQDRAPVETVQTVDLVVSGDRSRALAVVNYHP